MPMQPKELPDRIRPLEGAGMINLYGNMGVEHRRHWRWAAPVSVLIALGMIAVMVWAS